jgi:replicative DNA helicase
MRAAWTGEKPPSPFGEAADIHRMPPHSAEAEQGVLGSMLLARDAIAEAADKITPDFFYVPAHQVIFATLVEQWRKQRPTDLISSVKVLRDEKMDVVGGCLCEQPGCVRSYSCQYRVLPGYSARETHCARS